MIPNKACPVVLRTRGGERQILAFVHPEAGCQLVKGTIEPGESVERAALRELSEEAGLNEATVIRHLGVWPTGTGPDVWAFLECASLTEPPDRWAHDAPDDGGHTFRFFWHPLREKPETTDWHPVFQHALAYLQTIVD